MTRLEHPFEPVYDVDARVLVLGSFPSAGSVEWGGYCGHPSNAMWKIWSDLLERPLRDSVWSVRYLTLKALGIALWDSVGSCERDGRHEDGRLRNVVPTNVAGLVAALPNLQAIAFNGTKAEDVFLRHARRSFTMAYDARKCLHVALPIHRHWIETHRFPSTSAANRMKYGKKMEAWSDILRFVKRGLSAEDIRRLAGTP